MSTPKTIVVVQREPVLGISARVFLCSLGYVAACLTTPLWVPYVGAGWAVGALVMAFPGSVAWVARGNS